MWGKNTDLEKICSKILREERNVRKREDNKSSLRPLSNPRRENNDTSPKKNKFNLSNNNRNLSINNNISTKMPQNIIENKSQLNQMHTSLRKNNKRTINHDEIEDFNDMNVFNFADANNDTDYLDDKLFDDFDFNSLSDDFNQVNLVSRIDYVKDNLTIEDIENMFKNIESKEIKFNGDCMSDEDFGKFLSSNAQNFIEPLSDSHMKQNDCMSDEDFSKFLPSNAQNFIEPLVGSYMEQEEWVTKFTEFKNSIDLFNYILHIFGGEFLDNLIIGNVSGNGDCYINSILSFIKFFENKTDEEINDINDHIKPSVTHAYEMELMEIGTSSNELTETLHKNLYHDVGIVKHLTTQTRCTITVLFWDSEKPTTAVPPLTFWNNVYNISSIKDHYFIININNHCYSLILNDKNDRSALFRKLGGHDAIKFFVN